MGIPGGEAVYPGGITNSGEIAGTYSTQTINNHFFLRLPNGQYTTFDYPATGYLGSFVSINNHGDLAGSFAPSGQDYLGFVRSADTGMYTTFRIAGASETEVFGINDSNQVVGRYETSAGHSIGFIRNADGSYVTFEVPGQPDTFQLTLPRGINNAQTVVGTDGLYPPGFLRTSDGVIYAVTVGDFATEPAAVLDGDRVMGWYSAPGQYRGFVGDFSPVPEPATLLTGFIGLMVSVRRSLRSRPHRANFV